MNFFWKYLIIVIILLLGLYLLACLFGPKNLNVEVTKKMNASPTIIFNLVNNIQAQEQWSAWSLSDTTMVTTYPGTVEGLGAKSEWTSKKTGDGTQEIIESNAFTNIKTTLEFEGWSGTSYSNTTFDEDDDGTEVTWDFDAVTIPFLMRGMMLNGKSKMRKQFNTGLDNLAKIVEERANNIYDSYTIEEKLLPGRYFIMNRQEVKYDNIQQFYATNLGSLFGKVQAAGAEMNGMPCGLFFRFDEADGIIDMAAAIPTKEALSVPDSQSYSINAKKALQIDYYGDYHGIPKAHDAMDAFLKDRGYLQDVPVVEEYITDPGEEPDPEKWLTRITYYFTSK